MADSVIMPPPPVNPIVSILEKVLAEARAGRVASVAVVVAHNGSFAPFIAGANLADLYLGLASLQQDIMNAVRAPQNRSNIIRPLPGVLLS